MILLVTIDGLDWEALRDIVRKGDTPALASVLQAGRAAPLRRDIPVGGCAWWGSLATGAHPQDHGLTYPLEEWAGGLRPTSHRSWLRPPIWEVLAERGYPTASIAYPYTRPGRMWRGVHVDDRLLDIGGLGWNDWPLPLDVSPESIREDLRHTRVHTTDVSPAMLLPFEAVGVLDDKRRGTLAAALARASTLFAAVKVVTSATHVEFLAVHIDWPVGFASALGATGLELAGPVWSLLDGAVSTLLHCAGSGSTILLVSPGARGRAGFTVTAGPHSRPFGPSVLDVAPALLSCFGETMHGAAHFSSRADKPNRDDILRVESFGHIIPEPPSGWPAPKLMAEAELLLDIDLEAAGAKARAALSASPRSPHAIALAGLVAFASGDAEALSTYADELAEVAPDNLWATMLRAGCHILNKNAREAAPLLRRIEAEGDTDDRLRAAGAWLMLGRGSEAEMLFEKILAERPDCVPALLGLAARKTSRPFDAEQLLRRALEIDPSQQEARETLADLLDQCGRSVEGAAIRASAAHVID